jgi:hypothetical protein
MPHPPRGGFDALRYEVRHEDGISVEVDVTKWDQRGDEFDGQLQDPTGPPVPLAKLPPDLRKAVTQQIAFIRSLMGPQPRPAPRR